MSNNNIAPKIESPDNNEAGPGHESFIDPEQLINLIGFLKEQYLLPDDYGSRLVKEINMTSDELAFAQKVSKSLEAELAMSERRYSGQILDSCIIIKRRSTGGVPREFEPTSIYAPRDFSSQQYTMFKMIINGADFDYGRVYQLGENGLYEKRPTLHVPEFRVTTYAQLESVLVHLRVLRAQGLFGMDCDFPEKPLVGQPIPDLPGCYLGQDSLSGEPFYSYMMKVFQKTLLAALSTAREDASLVEIANRTAQLVQENSSDNGIDPTNHAFRLGAPVEKIMQIVNDITLRP